MELKLNGNINATNMQIGDNNIMTVTSVKKKGVFQEKDWKELEDFLSARLTELSRDENSYAVAKKSLDYVVKKDEKGFRKFLARNKESFFCNVLSDVASSGLILLLSKLSF